MKNTKIAVIDTMIDLNCTQLNLSAIEVDNRFCNDQDNYTSYPKGHGTAVCGIIQKYAPDAKIVLFPVSSSNDSSTLVKILNYIYERRICKIINLSLGFFGVGKKTTELHTVCQKLYSVGILIVSAYDNQGLMSYPACFDEVIGVDTSENVKGNNFIWVEGSPINIICSAQKKRVLWESGNKVYVKGNSFSVPYISSIIVEMLSSTNELIDVRNFLKKRATSVQNLSSIPQVHLKGNAINIRKAIIFPVNDDTLPLIAFNNDCRFDLVGVYDYKYSSKIGKKISNIFDGSFDIDCDIKSYDDIEWENDFDTIILGKIDEVQNSLQNDFINKLQVNCKNYGKSIFLLDDNITELLSENKTVVLNSLSSPMEAYPYALLGKKWVNSVFKICVAGSGMDGEKLFLQLQLKRALLNEGHNVGYLSTHKTGFLLGADRTFTYNKKQYNVISENDKSFILNNFIHEIELNDRDVIISGLLSEVLPSNTLSPNPIIFLQGTFLYTLLPDIVILVVSIDDNIRLIMRTINMIRATVDANIVCILVSTKKVSFRNGLTTVKSISGSNELLSFVKKIEIETGIMSLELNEKSIGQVMKECLRYVK